MSKDDTAVNEPAAPADTESAAVETGAAEDKDVMEQSLEELGGETDSSEELTSPDAEETSEPTEPKEQSSDGEKPLGPKEQQRNQKLANENRQLREQLATLSARESQVATEQELLNQINPETGDYYSPQEAERIARQQANEGLQQTLAQERYQLEVQQNQRQIASEANQVVSEFPIFDETSPDYRPEVAAEFDRLLGQALVVQNGVVLGSNISPYQLAKTIATSISVGETQGQIKGQQATQKMLANADVPSNSSNASKTKEDPMLEAFKAEAGM